MEFDIVIIGAGPTGLCLACALAKKNLKIAIVEKEPKNKFSNPINDGRDIALTHRSINILKKIDVWKHIKPNDISPIKEARVYDGDSKYFLHFDHKNTSENSLGFLVPNQIIRKAIYKKLQVLTKISIFTNKEVLKIENDNNFSKIYLKNKIVLKANLTVVSDGRLSRIRKKLGIYANIKNFKTSMTVFRMKHEKNNNNVASEYFHYSQTIAILPINKKLSSIVVTLPNKISNSFLKMKKKKLNKKIEIWLKSKLGKMSLIGKKYTYPMVTVYSNEFVGNSYALIGDAAIGMHPITAHGFNLNLRGISILSKEIINAKNNKINIGDPIVLKSYENKFKKITLPIYLATNSIASLYTNQSDVTKIARKSLLRLANIFWPIKNAIIDNLLIKNT